jgi:hypothetical protein
MSLTRDDHSVRINGHAVSVTGTTGSIEAKWTLSVDGQEVASTKAASGQFVLETELPDGSPVQAFVRQGAFGPTRVVVHHDGEEITRFKGFVA